MTPRDHTWQVSQAPAPAPPPRLVPEGQNDATPSVPATSLQARLAPGFKAQSVGALRPGRELACYVSLLRELVRGGEVDFVVRFGVLVELVCSESARWTSEQLGRMFAWLRPQERARVLKGLRRAGWLEMRGTEYQLTTEGSRIYSVLTSLLGSPPTAADLAIGVLEVEVARELGAEEDAPLRHLQHTLQCIIAETDDALASHSEVRIAQARQRLDRNLAWSVRARQLLDELELEDFSAYKTAQSIGRALSELHRRHGELQRALNAAARHATALDGHGLSLRDVTEFLMRCTPERIAQFASPYVRQGLRTRAAIADNLLAEAEAWFFLTERPDYGAGDGWVDGDPTEAEPLDASNSSFEALAGFARVVETVEATGAPVPLREAVASEDWAHSAYRLTLLGLVGQGGADSPTDEGALDEHLRAVCNAAVDVDADGESERVYLDAFSEITRGALRPRRAPDEAAQVAVGVLADVGGAADGSP